MPADGASSAVDRRLRTAGIVVLVVLVVGLAAASIATTKVVERGGGAGITAGNPSAASEAGESASGQQPLVGWLAATIVVLFVVGVLSDPREFLRRTLSLAVAAVVLLGLILVLILSSGQTGPNEPQQAGRELVEGAQQTAGQVGLGPGPTNTSPALLLAIGVVVLLAFGVLAALTGDGSGRLRPVGGDSSTEEEILAAMGRSAGRAAERLADTDADVDNEVYRAWEEMTDHLDVDERAARTPGEFRTAALAAGMGRADVDVLTALFEEVRYGGAPATEDRERDAIEALRRIEAQYADAGEGAS